MKNTLKLFPLIFIHDVINTTADAGMTPEMKTYYSKYLIEFTKALLVHDQFGQKHPIPKGGGKKVEFRKKSPFAKATTPLVEGVTPSGKQLSWSILEATVNQYGDFVMLTDRLITEAIDSNIVYATENCSDQAGRTLDTITREVLNSGTNVQYADANVNARYKLVGGEATGNHYMTTAAVKRAVHALKVGGAKPMNGDYVAIIHPDVSFDLTGDTNWIDIKKYTDPSDIYEGEIGKLYGCRFVETTEAKIFAADDLASNSRNLAVNGAVNASTSVTFDGGTVAINALAGRYVLIGDNKVKVVSNTATVITLETALSAADNAVIYPGEAGAKGRSVYSTLFLGADAYGTSFMSEPITSYSMFLRAAQDYFSYEKGSPQRRAASKVIARTLTSLVVADIVVAAAASLVDAIRDDDKEQSYWEKWLEAFIGLDGGEEKFSDYIKAIFGGNLVGQINPLTKIPYAKDLLSLMQGYDVSRMDMESFDKVNQSLLTLTRTLSGSGKVTIPNALADTLASVAYLLGVPVANLKRDLLGLVGTGINTSGNLRLAYEYDKLLFDVNSKANRKRFLDTAFLALKNGDIDTYKYVTSDLMKNGATDAEKLEAGMRSRLKAETDKDPKFTLPQAARDLIGSREHFAEPKTADNSFKTGDLSPEEYKQYTNSRAKDYREIAAAMEDIPAFRNWDAKTKNKLYEAAYSLAEQTALEEASDGKYKVDTEWIIWAIGGKASGVEPSEAITFKGLYDTVSGDKDENGKTISGSKKENVLEQAEVVMPWLTPAELEYLKSNYWKE